MCHRFDASPAADNNDHNAQWSEMFRADNESRDNLRGMHTRAAALVILSGCLTGLAGCGGGATSASPTTQPTTQPTTPPATPHPSPEDQRVVVVQSGFGAYLETTFAGALVRNNAAAHAARSIAVHLVVTAGTRQLGSADAHFDSLGPGATVPAGGRIQGAPAAGESVTATVTVGGWDAGNGPTPPATAGPAAFSCPRCTGSGAGSGDVTTSLTLAATTPPGFPLALTALCSDAGGHIVGGGAEVFAPPAGARTAIAADIPAVVSAPPATCSVAAGPGGL